MSIPPARPSNPPMAEAGKRPPGGEVGGKASPVPAPGAKRGDSADDEDEWRHPPVAPVDESNPLRSLGKAVGDTVTGSDDKPAAPKR